MTVREFVDGYEKNATEGLKDRYIKEKIKINKYLPFLRKDAIATVLAERSMYEYEKYTKEDGAIGFKKTDVMKMNSVAQYLLFCRVIIENYTNLTIETEGFYEEYDLLKQSGLLDKLMVGTEQVAPFIPADEISELRSLLDLKQKDILFNETEVHNYISGQVERFGNLFGFALKPALDKIAESIQKMDDKDIEKFGDKLAKALKKVK